MSINTDQGRMRCTVTGEYFGPEFSSQDEANEFLGFTGYFPEGWRKMTSFSVVSKNDPRRFSDDEMAAEVERFRARRTGGWITTYTGKQFWPLDPRPEDVDIEDIAHALSMKCRFGGHTRAFYSVAQHCFLASHFGPPKWCLLHDAAEAYLADVPRSIKADLSGFEEIETKIMRAVATAFDLSPTFEFPIAPPPGVRHIDEKLLVTEYRDLMPERPAPWPGKLEHIEPFDWTIEPFSAEVAKAEFLRRFKEVFEPETVTWIQRHAIRHPDAG